MSVFSWWRRVFSKSIQRFMLACPGVGLSKVFAEGHNLNVKLLPDTVVSAFASIDRPCLRIALWLAISVSALCGRPLHELEHAPHSNTGTAPACSCSHLHGTMHFQSHDKPATADHSSPYDSGQPDTGDTHQHGQCQICLTFWLQSPFQVISPEVQSREVPVDRLLLSNDHACCSTSQNANARGPPAAA